METVMGLRFRFFVPGEINYGNETQEKMNTFSASGGLQVKYTQNICITPEQIG